MYSRSALGIVILGIIIMDINIKGIINIHITALTGFIIPMDTMAMNPGTIDTIMRAGRHSTGNMIIMDTVDIRPNSRIITGNITGNPGIITVKSRTKGVGVTCEIFSGDAGPL